MRDIDGVLYANDGEWVDSQTAMVEAAAGRLEINDWTRLDTALPALQPSCLWRWRPAE